MEFKLVAICTCFVDGQQDTHATMADQTIRAIRLIRNVQRGIGPRMWKLCELCR